MGDFESRVHYLIASFRKKAAIKATIANTSKIQIILPAEQA